MEFTYEMVRVLAHDLKGPAGNIKMFSEILNAAIGNIEEGKPVDEEDLETLKEMGENVEVLTAKYIDAIENWADTYALALDEYDLQMEDFYPGEIAEQLVEDQGRFIRRKNITINTFINDDPIRADKRLFSRAMDVLLSVLIMYAEPESQHYVQLSNDKLMIGTYPDTERKLIDEYLLNPSDVFDERYYKQSLVKSSGFGLVFVYQVLRAHDFEFGLKEYDGSFAIEIRLGN